MLIFGYGPRRPHDLGPVLPDDCPLCGNHTLWHLVRQTSWFSLFFVPVVPGGSQWALRCATCGGVVAVDKATGTAARDLIRARADHEAGHGDPTDYARRSADLLQRIHRAGGPLDDTVAPMAWPGPTHPGGGAPPGTDPWARPTGPPPTGGPPPAAAPPDPATRRPDPPAGWYADPFEEAEERYWDGQRWTRGTKPPTPAPDEPR